MIICYVYHGFTGSTFLFWDHHSICQIKVWQKEGGMPSKHSFSEKSRRMTWFFCEKSVEFRHWKTLRRINKLTTLYKFATQVRLSLIGWYVYASESIPNWLSLSVTSWLIDLQQHAHWVEFWWINREKISSNSCFFPPWLRFFSDL